MAWSGTDFQKTGYNIWVTFSTQPDLTMAIKSVTDAGLEAGDPIDITTNASINAREEAPPDLASPSEISFTAAYRLEDRATFAAMLGVPQTISIEYRKCNNRPVGQKIEYAGAFVKSFVPGDMSEGNFPEVTVTIGLPGGTHTGDATSYHPEGNLTTLS